MPSFCVVDNCCDKYGHAESISFHKFPFKRKDLLQIWTEFAQRGPTWKPTKWSAICSQHFTAEDFNCANSRKTLKKTAVPTIRLGKRQTGRAEHVGNAESKKAKPIKTQCAQSKDVPSKEMQLNVVEAEGGEQISSITPKSVLPLGPKINCRLCGVSASAACTFSTNFEIFGMIQKCFPTLNIQQDDNLPKDMCNTCLKRLQSFSEFIDTVLEAQRELQQKFRPEKHIKQSLEPRSLKIKQEPIVKVKQEVAEGLESFISEDLDVAMDECCEPENDNASVDQKFGFCDFPMLNAQDIINNCDIMEIINLEDAFINIPDDDAATINAGSHVEKTCMTSAHQLLLTHMLIDEHNYACPAEDLKEEWQIKKCCKTEEADAEIELYEQLEAAEASAEDDYQNGAQVESVNACVNVGATPTKRNEVERSSRPIVTSVSAIAESRLQVHNQLEDASNNNKNILNNNTNISNNNPNISNNNSNINNNNYAKISNNNNSNISSNNNNNNNPNNSSNNKIVVTSISDLLPVTSHPKPPAHKESVSSCKPNIVVLNESIVKSTEAFQLHACAVCQLKFFGIESLQQHVSFTHMRSNVAATNTIPMVSLPLENLTQGIEAKVLASKDNNNLVENHDKPRKLIEYNELLDQKHQETDSENVLSQQLRNLQSWQLNMKTLQMNALINTWTHGQASNGYPNSVDLQQDCNKAQPLNDTQIDEIYAAPQQQDVIPDDSKTAQELEEVKIQLRAPEEQVFKAPQSAEKKISCIGRPTNGLSKSKAKCKALQQLAAPNALTCSNIRPKLKNIDKTSPHHFAVNYKFLQRRYSQLLRKCKELEENCQVLASGNKRATANHTCPQCNSSFFNIYQLLQHKQKYHRPPKIYSVFSASCHGCEKYFLSKLALRNHMKYICQSLSLRWFKTQLQTFKCRQCRSISFTHWRIFRHHEISCKRKMQLQQCRRLHKCTQCAKKFAHVHTLALHIEALHHAAWNLKCLHCNRKFQCLSLLMQHHSKASCKVNPSFDCTVLCCTCGQYFQHYNILLTHQHCYKGYKNPPAAAAKNSQHQQRSAKISQYACNMCPKVFASSNSLSQHRITHTHERRHKCGLCLRAFKRRGGLTQHMKSFHLQLKPYECPVCKYRYSLKCDMQRCKHSLLQKRNVDDTVIAVEE